MDVLRIGRKGEKSVLNFKKSLSIDTKNKDLSNIVERVNQFQAGSQISGQLVSQNSCYFNGVINGNIEIHNKLVLGENSEVNGDVFAKNLLIKGKVHGNITVENKIILSSSASVKSKNLNTNLLEVENGAVLNINNLVMQASSKNAALFPKLPDFSNNANKPINESKPINLSREINSNINDDDSFFFKIFQNQ